MAILNSSTMSQHTLYQYASILRDQLEQRFPDLEFYFQPADIVSQILNFGLAAPIDVQVVGANRQDTLAVAQDLMNKFRTVPGAADVHLMQVPSAPEIKVNVDRTRAMQLGLSQRDVASSLLTSLSGSAQAAPNYWLNPKNGVNYPITVQTPNARFQDMDDLANTPLPGTTDGNARQLQSVATVARGASPVAIGHYNVQPVFDVLVSAEGTDLATVGGQVERIVNEARKDLPKGTQLAIRGQYESMRTSFLALAGGLLAAILLVYFLMVVNFQSWLDPFIIIFAVPGALAGAVFMLLCTHTTFSVPSLMGAIMCVGVGTANAILVVTFANDCRAQGDDADRCVPAGTTAACALC